MHVFCTCRSVRYTGQLHQRRPLPGCSFRLLMASWRWCEHCREEFVPWELPQQYQQLKARTSLFYLWILPSECHLCTCRQWSETFVHKLNRNSSVAANSSTNSSVPCQKVFRKPHAVVPVVQVHNVAFTFLRRLCWEGTPQSFLSWQSVSAWFVNFQVGGSSVIYRYIWTQCVSMRITEIEDLYSERARLIMNILKSSLPLNNNKDSSRESCWPGTNEEQRWNISEKNPAAKWTWHLCQLCKDHWNVNFGNFLNQISMYERISAMKQQNKLLLAGACLTDCFCKLMTTFRTLCDSFLGAESLSRIYTW